MVNSTKRGDLNMQKYLDLLDTNLIFIKSERIDDTFKIYCESKTDDYRKIHSRKFRVIRDINYDNLKVKLHILNKKYFNEDPFSTKLTTSKKFKFINTTGRRTKRLDEYILNLCAETSVIGCERIIKNKIADVSDSSILRLLKKLIL